MEPASGVLLDRLKKWLASPRMPAWIVLVAVAVGLPTLRLGLYLDDRWHRAMLLGDARWAPPPPSPLMLFSFAQGTPEEHRFLLDRGVLPWWTSPSLRMAFFRPVASLTHVLDYALWPRTPALMHLHSVAWYAALVAIVVALYRRILGRARAEPWIIGLAALMYAVDVTHGIPIGWLANRNALCAATFGFGALYAYDARRSLLATVLLVLALGSGESALAIAPFFAAHALYLDPRPAHVRVRALGGPIVAFLAYALVHRVGRFGVIGSGVYVSPVHDPGRFAAAAFTRLPLLVGSELGAPPPDFYPFLPLPGRIALLGIALAIVALAGFGLWKLRASPEARFFAASGVLGALPGCATAPSARLMLVAGFGLVGLLAMIAGAVSERPRWLRAYVVWACGVHIAVSPILLVAAEHAMPIMSGVVDRAARGVPTDPSVESKRLVVVTAPDTAFIYYLAIDRIEEGVPVPHTMRTIAGGNRDVRITRESDRTLSVHADGGFWRRGTDLLFRGLDEPMPVGTRLELEDVTITIVHTLPDGVPDDARFELAAPLESDRWLFVAWNGDVLAPFALPRIGETRLLPGKDPPLL